MHAAKTILLLILVAVLAAGCTAAKSGTVASSNEWRLQSLEESYLNFKEAQRAEEEKRQEADQHLRERMSLLEERLAVLEEKLGMDRLDTDMGEVPMPPEQGGETIVGGAESDDDRPWADVPGAAEEPSQPAMTHSSTMTAQQLYDRGLKLVLAEQPVPARKAFNSFLAKYPASDLTPNAVYWLGETYYTEKDYAQAILTFKEVTTKYPQSSKAPAALLKIGMSYEMTGDRDNARFYYNVLLSDYPSSDPARMARQRIKGL